MAEPLTPPNSNTGYSTVFQTSKLPEEVTTLISSSWVKLHDVTSNTAFFFSKTFTVSGYTSCPVLPSYRLSLRAIASNVPLSKTRSKFPALVLRNWSSRLSISL
ncbi:hypothetical protein OGATHE_001897 [Ogataea polymorpha]|uniref:Uncharacterized protein n=1 Tax=Ogataea polymorpha TaxID=460523 RepID=A0A9P8PM21_9ASCO|nr:hypothetical protein OGATHE_001897 [Ogataea polymorpha]